MLKFGISVKGGISQKEITSQTDLILSQFVFKKDVFEDKLSISQFDYLFLSVCKVLFNG